MSERIRGSYDDALYKSTYTLLYFTLLHSGCRDEHNYRPIHSETTHSGTRCRPLPVPGVLPVGLHDSEEEYGEDDTTMPNVPDAY